MAGYNTYFIVVFHDSFTPQHQARVGCHRLWGDTCKNNEDLDLSTDSVHMHHLTRPSRRPDTNNGG